MLPTKSINENTQAALAVRTEVESEDCAGCRISIRRAALKRANQVIE